MALTLSVGLLAREIARGSARVDALRAEFARLNAGLEAAGQAPHHEPEELAEEAIFQREVADHSHLHLLRRIAAHDALSAGLPASLPEAGETDENGVVDLYYDRGGAPIAPGIFGFVSSFVWRRPPVYQHLMFHGDTAGFYLPRDFKNVIIADDELEVPGNIVGSAQRLLDECRRLAERLELPVDYEYADLEQSWTPEEAEEADHPPTWRAHADAAHCLVALRSACRASIHTGAVVYFD